MTADREAFEKWALTQNWRPEQLASFCSEGSPRSGEYHDLVLEREWSAWQAALQSLQAREGGSIESAAQVPVQATGGSHISDLRTPDAADQWVSVPRLPLEQAIYYIQ